MTWPAGSPRRRAWGTALLPRLGFWPTLLACVVITLVSFAAFAALVRRFGIDLL